MMKFDFIHKVAVAVTVICALFASSCEYVVEELKVEVSEETVSYEKGNVFINVKCPGAWTLYLVSTDEGDADWARLETGKEAGTGDESLIVLYYDKNGGTEDRALKIVLDNGVDWAECLFTQKCEKVAQDPEDPDRPNPDDYDRPDDPDPGQGTDLSKTGWMELPAMDDPELEYYSHSFEMGGKTYRNYSFGWSQKDYVSVWVAYPLCSLYTNGSYSRTNEWALDPLLGNNSSAPFGGYGGDYDRGHQLPAADRKCSYEANAQTFYGTNMTPQDPTLNQNTWAGLEGMIRSYANGSDTTYVVTGCILDGSTERTKDSNRNQMTVPTGYFKAVLRYAPKSTHGTWNAIAFYFKHEPCSRQVQKSDAMSIDALEEMTGMDFFVNLPAKVGEEKAASIEATDPANVAMWW